MTRILSERFNWVPYFESVNDNPYLKDFYDNMSRWSFNLQIYFLAHRFQIHKEINEKQRSVIQDRSIYEDVEIFANNLHKLGKMDVRDYQTYSNLFHEMTYYLKPPDLLVYLKADVRTLINQIKMRGRDFEKNIDIKYLEELNRSYDEWISNYKHGLNLTVNTDDIDFVHSENDLNFVLNSIEKELHIELKLFT